MALEATYVRTIARLDAPAKWRALRGAWLKNAKAYEREAGKTRRRQDGHTKINAAIDSYNAVYSAKLNRRFNKAGVTSCAGVTPA